MALRVGDKVFRNLPEEVAYLQQKVIELNEVIKNKEYAIKEIDIVNGHLIFTFDDDSTIDAGEVKSIVSMAFDATKHLIVTYNTGDEVDLGQVKGLVSISLNASKHMIVTYDDGTSADLGLFRSLDHFTLDASYHLWAYYNDGTSADLGAVISGTIDFTTLDLVAKTLEQSQANWSVDFNLVTRDNPFTYTKIYHRLEVIGNILYVIVNGKLTNNTGSTASIVSNTDVLNSGDSGITVPNKYGTKIVDLEGKYLTEYSISYITFAALPCSKELSGNTGIIDNTLFTLTLKHWNFNSVRICIYPKTPITLNDGESLWLSGRIPLTLL